MYMCFCVYEKEEETEHRFQDCTQDLHGLAWTHVHGREGSKIHYDQIGSVQEGESKLQGLKTLVSSYTHIYRDGNLSYLKGLRDKTLGLQIGNGLK